MGLSRHVVASGLPSLAPNTKQQSHHATPAPRLSRNPIASISRNPVSLSAQFSKTIQEKTRPHQNMSLPLSSFRTSTHPSAFLGRSLRAALASAAAQVPSRRVLRPTTSIWLDNKAEVQVGVPVEEAFKLWENRELIPKWMPWIASVKVQEDKPELSQWTLRWDAFGQNVEVKWLARNMQPVANQKIHWRSVDGLPNRGAVRFFRKGPSACNLEMTISYEVPGFLLPFAAPLGPLVESIIKADLDRFAVYAKKVSASA